MVHVPKRPCTSPGCREFSLPGSSKCSQHEAVRRQQVEARRAADADQARYRRWYKLRIWYARRHDCLKAALFRCATPGCLERATDVDHIKPHRGNWDLFIDRNNLQALCKGCHSRKTAKEDGGFGR